MTVQISDKHLRFLFKIYFICIIILSIAPINTGASLNNITVLSLRGDYFFHILLFLPWMFLAWQLNRNILLWILFGIITATATELVQWLLPYRSFNINDLLANVIGVLAGGIIIFLVTRMLTFQRLNTAGKR
jgi:glycopeptide antibiotics resistance protein